MRIKHRRVSKTVAALMRDGYTEAGARDLIAQLDASFDEEGVAVDIDELFEVELCEEDTAHMDAFEHIAHNLHKLPASARRRFAKRVLCYPLVWLVVYKRRLDA